jgi:hypothetical protein
LLRLRLQREVVDVAGVRRGRARAAGGDGDPERRHHDELPRASVAISPLDPFRNSIISFSIVSRWAFNSGSII